MLVGWVFNYTGTIFFKKVELRNKQSSNTSNNPSQILFKSDIIHLKLNTV
ncbi:hypothetical protein KSS87_007660 [Heliosperma pusillum]|nr:hypothetical protein KSS87_007660 [Heliosperma pusillum]